ncbi:MAG TPA: ABC transporter substrate-binding protein [Candidatus Blautia excrementipullorum]|nr:ABC transporter substrate-binding protein [Candidatus Blautia excrementipullorum]
MKKKVLAGLLAAVTTVSMVASVPVFADDAETIKIGTLYPLTGDVASIGQNIMRGVEFAVNEINENGGVDGKQIEIVQGDSKGDTKTGMTEAERLITQENVCAILGAYQSSVTEVVAQVAEQYQVPMLTAISTADSLTETGYEYFFRLAPTNSMFLRDMIQFLVDESAENEDVKVESIAVCADNTLLGQETAEWAKYFAEEQGIEYLGEVLYSKGAADLSSEVIQLKDMNPDALVVDNYISDGILLTKTMAEQGYKPNIMIGKATAYIDPSYIPAVGDLCNGIVTAAEFNPGTKGKEISDAFAEEYGVDMNGHSAEAYTAMWVLKTAIENAGSTEREDIKNALKEIKIEGSFPGGSEIILPYDTIEFTDVEMNGQKHTNTNASATLTILQIQDGAYKTVWPMDIADAEIQYPATYE